MKKLLLLSAILIFACSTDSEGNPCIYEPTLTTQAATDITETSATLNGVISIVSENCDVPNNTEQGFVYSTEIQPTLEDIQINVNGTNISTTIEGLTPNTTYYVRVFLTNNFGDFYGDEVSFSTTDIPCDVVYLDDNGITIKACDDANIGDVGTINGVEYTVVDRDMLDEMLSNDEDLTKACITRITDMNYMFVCYEGFNQPIGNWDVSNVTNMGGMFNSECSASLFNQDISLWDVSGVTNMSSMFGGNAGNSSDRAFNQDISQWDTSSVTDMSFMFYLTPFNQDIGSWDVSNVTDMKSMFRYSDFNQPIGDWDVSSVNSMEDMFLNSDFNQPIGDWDVSNVTDMEYMFYGRIFNQPIGDWDVSNVTNMERMFSGSDFNQPIGDWDVSSVTNMYDMFYGSIFNQPIGDWDVSNVTDMTGMFRYSDFNQPIGDWDVSSVNSMTRMFLGNDSFNQDLSNWDVEIVIYCIEFSLNANQWTLPQPNFTNCNP